MERRKINAFSCVRWRKIAVFHLISIIYLVYYGGLLIYSVSKNVPIFIRFTHTRVSLILIMFSHYIKQYSAYPKIFTVSVLFCKYIIVLFFCLMYAYIGPNHLKVNSKINYFISVRIEYH